VRRVEPDLLLRLAQRGRGQVRVLGIVAAAGERDLALMVRQEVRAPGEEQARLASTASSGTSTAATVLPGGARTIRWRPPSAAASAVTRASVTGAFLPSVL